MTKTIANMSNVIVGPDGNLNAFLAEVSPVEELEFA